MDPMLFIAALVAAGVLIVALTHAGLVARQSIKNTKTRKPNEEGPIKEKPEGLSTNFSALIDAIAQGGQSSRDEEKREDDLKQTREWLTIALLIATVVLLGWQIDEMRAVYGPIKDQAEAAKASATAALAQSRNSEKALIQTQRAWVGPRNATLTTEIAIGKLVEANILFENSGHEPAIGFTYAIDFLSELPPPRLNASNKIQASVDACLSKKDWTGGSVVYPSGVSLGGGGGTLTFKTSDAFVTEAEVKGYESIVIVGCFTYRTFDQEKHSHFCYFFKQGVSKISALNICQNGYAAD
jgi:hypothetical protein